MDTIVLSFMDNLREQVLLAKTRTSHTRLFCKFLSHEIGLQHLCISENVLSCFRSHWFTKNCQLYFHHGAQYYADICVLSLSQEPSLSLTAASKSQSLRIFSGSSDLLAQDSTQFGGDGRYQWMRLLDNGAPFVLCSSPAIVLQVSKEHAPQRNMLPWIHVHLLFLNTDSALDAYQFTSLGNHV